MSDGTSPVVLRYVGAVGGVPYYFVCGLPARNLTEDDVERSGKTIDELLAYRDVYEIANDSLQEEITDGR